MHAPRTGRSHSFAGQLAGLLHPSGELSFVELVVLMDVEVARVLALGLAGGTERSDALSKFVLKLHYNELMTFASQWNNGAGFPLMACLVNRRVQ